MKNLRIRSMYLCISLLVVGCIVYTHLQVRELWKDVALRQALLQDVPSQLAHTSELQKDLLTAKETMKRLDATIPTHNQVADVVSAISRTATSLGVSSQVPTVEGGSEEQDSSGDDLFSDVRMHVVASGNPSSLMAFLYSIEHLPYFVRIVSWNMDTLQQTAISSFTSEAPQGSSAVAPALGSSLQADIVLVTRKQ